MRHADPCVLCGASAQTIDPPGFDGLHQECALCGEFKISRTALAGIAKRMGAYGPQIRGWIRDQLRTGAVPEMTTYTLDALSQRKLPSLLARADRILFENLDGAAGLNVQFNVKNQKWQAVSYSREAEDVNYLLRFLAERELVRPVGTQGNYEVTPKGHLHFEEQMANRNESQYGFVAMWFDDSMRPAFEVGFEPAILENGYDAIRIDQTEHINKIDDEIIARINQSRFLVADFTGHRGGVYFEAGYAMGKDIPIFWTCRKDDLSNLHFDIRQYNCIDWESPEELSLRLKHRIEAVMGKMSEVD